MDPSVFNNPIVMNALENKLNTLVGTSSGYVESLPIKVQERLSCLAQLQLKNMEIESQFRQKVLELEKSFKELHQPIYDQRSLIIQGVIEPAQIKDFSVPESEQDDTEAKAQDQSVGISEFWLTCFKNHPMINETITPEDEPALAHLIDIKVHYLDENPGFKLEFVFSSNDYFTDSSLFKTYFLSNEPESSFGEMIYDHAEGCEINWKTEKNLCVKFEIKKQRHKGTKETRTVKKTVPCDSFFNFFKPLKVPESEEEEEELPEDFEDKLELDYEIGENIKEKIIPYAIDWFTGKALENEFSDEEDEEEEDWEEEDNEDDDEDDDEDNDQAVVGKDKIVPADGEKPPDCKQS